MRTVQEADIQAQYPRAGTYSRFSSSHIVGASTELALVIDGECESITRIESPQQMGRTFQDEAASAWLGHCPYEVSHASSVRNLQPRTIGQNPATAHFAVAYESGCPTDVLKVHLRY